MEGRRVNHSAPKRNPLYVMFLCLVAAVFVLLIVVIVLGAKLGAAQKAAKGAETQIEELQEQVKRLEEEKKAAEDAANEPDEKLPGEDTPAVDPNETKEPDTSVSDSKRKVGWLDLTGHSEVTVLPKKVFNEYASYYTTAGVNLRSGPSTSYGKVQLVDRGTKVKAAAKEGNWTFVSVGSKFGGGRSSGGRCGRDRPQQTGSPRCRTGWRRSGRWIRERRCAWRESSFIV